MASTMHPPLRALCFLGVALLWSCSESLETVPGSLQGTWTTSNAGFAGRTMILEEARVSFGTGDGELASHPVVGIHRRSDEAGVRYAVDYLAETGAEYRLHLLYNPGSGELRLVGRRQVVWIRQRG